ncbi:hypothetical protein V8G54_005665 [Vigna mungo]|uniref:Uncharacterized protein n=1 Tax=Vigna mungo TaxID=3915 RepID=A0AAQ3NZ12_VIGMU
MQLEVELHALEKEKDKAKKVRLVEVRKELDDLRDNLQPLMMKYRKEKERMDEIQRLKQKREELNFALLEAERRYDFARAANLRYGAIQEVESAIQELQGNTEENVMLTETVGPEHIVEGEIHHIGEEELCLPLPVTPTSTSPLIMDNPPNQNPSPEVSIDLPGKVMNLDEFTDKTNEALKSARKTAVNLLPSAIRRSGRGMNAHDGKSVQPNAEEVVLSISSSGHGSKTKGGKRGHIRFKDKSKKEIRLRTWNLQFKSLKGTPKKKGCDEIKRRGWETSTANGLLPVLGSN